MVVVIHSWVRGGTSVMRGYSTNPNPYNPYSQLDPFTCTTIDRTPFRACASFSPIGPGYITESCYNSLNTDEKGACPPLFAGIVTDSGHWTTWLTPTGSTKYKFNPASIIPYPVDDPCKDVSCPDMCVGVDKYQGACQDGICVRGTLIETDSVHCGYTPEPTPDPTPTPSSDTYIIVALMLAGTYMILRR